MADWDWRRTRGAALRRGACLLALAALLAVHPVAAVTADAATPTTYQGGPMGTPVATQDKPQSKLWRHDGSWWALMNGQVDDDVHIHRLAADHTWEQTGPEVDTRRSYGDVLADGDTLYVLSRRTGTGGTVLVRFVYDQATGSYRKDAGYPVTVITAPTESATIAKDSTGMLWVAYTAPDAAGVPKVWVTHSTGASDNTWLPPFELPVADTTVSADDIAAVVALDGKIGVMWSNQVSDTFRFATHQDGAPPDQWAIETALSGLNMADDHINLKKATDGRLFAAVKTSLTTVLSPRILLLVRQTDGTWSNHVHSTRGDGMTRPILLLDETHRRLFLFAASAEGTGAQTYYKTTSMDAPAFGPGQGAPFVSWPGTTLTNATSTKQPVDPASGAVVLSGDRVGSRYYHAELPLAPETTIDQAPAARTSSTSATFAFSSDEAEASFECKLDGALEFTPCTSPKDYLGLAPGAHTFEVRAVDAAGNRDASPASHAWTIQVAAAPVVAAAGDVACASSTPLPAECRQMATSDLLVGMSELDAVLAVGDLQAPCGELQSFQTFYEPSWGRVKPKTRPVPGEVEYKRTGCLAPSTAGAPGYFSYFGDAATPLQPGCGVSCRGYYSFDLGDWHVVALNSNCGKAGGCQEGSPQETWLRSDLATTTKSCILAYGHHPRYASKGGASTKMQPLWAALYEGGADLVLTGHARVYERFARLGPGAPDSLEPTVDPNGMRQIIVGTGGRSHHSFTTIRPGSEVRNADTFGVLKLVLHSGRYDWEFLPEADKAFTDSGSDTCQGAPRPGDTEPPSAPSSLSATAAGPSRVDLSWTAATDNVGVTGYGIYRDGTLIDTSSSTAYADQTAQPGTTYQYAVDAVDAKGNRSPLSAPASATTPASPTAFRSSSFVSSSSRTTSLTVAAPAGTTAGDVMVASVNVRGLPTITAPPGWNLLSTDVNSTVMTMATYYRVVEVAEPLAYTWSFSLKKAAAGGIVAYSGVDAASPIDASDGLVNASSATITAPSITTTVPETRLVGFFGTATRTTVTPPAGMTERGDVASTFRTDATLEGSDRVQSAAGPSGQQMAVAAARARNIGHLVALRPAP